jgi:hypothetical protein
MPKATAGFRIIMTMKVLVADPISQRGVEMLRQNASFQVDVNTAFCI